VGRKQTAGKASVRGRIHRSRHRSRMRTVAGIRFFLELPVVLGSTLRVQDHRARQALWRRGTFGYDDDAATTRAPRSRRGAGQRDLPDHRSWPGLRSIRPQCGTLQHWRVKLAPDSEGIPEPGVPRTTSTPFGSNRFMPRRCWSVAVGPPCPRAGRAPRNDAHFGPFERGLAVVVCPSGAFEGVVRTYGTDWVSQLMRPYGTC